MDETIHHILKLPDVMKGERKELDENEWKEIKDSGKFEQEVIKICPNVKAGDLSQSVQENIIDFAIEFANDSGNVPSC